MMKKILLGISALLVIAGVVVVRAPAQVLADQLHQRFPQIALNETQGSIWTGRANQLQFNNQTLGALSWRIHPAALLRGQWQIDLDLSGRDLVLDTSVLSNLSGENLSFSGLKGHIPSAWLQIALNTPFLILLGQLELNLNELTITGGELVAIEGRTTWAKAAIGGNIKTELGDLYADWRSDTDRIVGRLSDSGGPLNLSGNITVASQQYQVAAGLRARNNQVELAQALRLMGRADQNQTVYLNIQGPMLNLERL